jgi:hypothetical protein
MIGTGRSQRLTGSQRRPQGGPGAARHSRDSLEARCTAARDGAADVGLRAPSAMPTAVPAPGGNRRPPFQPQTETDVSASQRRGTRRWHGHCNKREFAEHGDLLELFEASACESRGVWSGRGAGRLEPRESFRNGTGRTVHNGFTLGEIAATCGIDTMGCMPRRGRLPSAGRADISPQLLNSPAL